MAQATAGSAGPAEKGSGDRRAAPTGTEDHAAQVLRATQSGAVTQTSAGVCSSREQPAANHGGGLKRKLDAIAEADGGET